MRTNLRRTLATVVALTALSAGAGGCGGSSSSSPPSAPQASTVPSVPEAGASGTSDAAPDARPGLTETVPLADLTLPPPPTIDAATAGEIATATFTTPGTLTACSAVPYAPFEYFENGADGRIVGIDADLIEAIATSYGLTDRIIATPLDTLFDALADGTCDVVASAIPMTLPASLPGSATAFNVTSPYLTVRDTLLVRAADRNRYTAKDGLKNATVGVISASDTDDAARRLAATSGAKVQRLPGTAELLDALRSGTVDVVLQDSARNGFEVTRSDGAFALVELPVSTAPDNTVPDNTGPPTSSGRTSTADANAFVLVVRADNPALTRALNASIARLRTRGELRSILRTWIGAAATG